MKPQQKTALALAACAQHQQDYGVKAPARLLDFWKNGEALRYHGMCLPKTMRIPQFDAGTFRLAALPPLWTVLSEAGGLDDALSGPDGEWAHAKSFLPLFLADQSSVIVARLDSPQCPVGWYEDGAALRDDGDGYKQGVYQLTPSLDAFLAMLVNVASGEADYETELGDEFWEALGDSDEGDDDDDE